MLARLILVLTLSLLSLGPVYAQVKPASPDDTLIMELKTGTVTIVMRPDLAPIHVARIKQLVRRGYYNQVPFHRVVPGFMAQTGDRTGTGHGGTGKWMELEPSKTPHVRGTVSMARGANKNSGDSQFFIVTGDNPALDGKYTVWGKVTSGMNLIDKLKPGDKNHDGWVTGADRIISLRVASDPVPAPKPVPPSPAKPASATPATAKPKDPAK